MNWIRRPRAEFSSLTPHTPPLPTVFFHLFGHAAGHRAAVRSACPAGLCHSEGEGTHQHGHYTGHRLHLRDRPRRVSGGGKWSSGLGLLVTL